MSAALTPYLNFRGNTREAMEFYQSVFGGEVSSMTFAEQGGMGVPDGEQDNVMHSQINVGDAPFLMAADVPSTMELSSGSSISCALSGDDEAKLTGWWEGLTDGATITAPLNKAPWGDSFGMLVDKFGVSWLVNISGAPAAD